MGHITIELLDDSWVLLEEAEENVQNGETYVAVKNCTEALQKLYRSSRGLDEEEWFAKNEAPIQTKINNAKHNKSPQEAYVEEIIEDIKTLALETKERIVPKLHERIDYNPEPTEF